MGHDIRGLALAACRVALFALCAVIGLAKAANQGCLDTDPLPSAPTAGAAYVFFDAVQYSGDQNPDDKVRIELWRLSCSPAPSRLIVRMTPTSGLPYACGLNFSVIQGEIPHTNFVLRRDGASANGVCDYINGPTSFVLTQCDCSQFDEDRAFTLVYNRYGNSVTYSINVAPFENKPDIPPAPIPGLWWNPDESGTGYAIGVQHGVLAMTIYSYQPNGTQEWYYVSGPLTNNGQTFTGTLDKYRGGQCISCSIYPGRPMMVGNDGVVTINFSSRIAATVTLPGGRVTNIQLLEF